MPARVHALLVVRPEGAGDETLQHLEHTLELIGAQTRAVDALTVVVCGRATAELRSLAGRGGAEAVIEAARGTGYAAALRMASVRLGAAEAVWLLAQDTAPEPGALRLLAGALESQPSVSMVAPKLRDARDPDLIVSLGVSMTALGRTVGLVDGQLDQGQHDAAEDALAADVRGMLVRRQIWDLLGGVDPALLGADEGLDLGVRARLAGGRVALVPAASVVVHGDGVAGLPAPTDSRRRGRRAYASRTAALHRRLTYANAALVPLIWLSILPLALARSVMHLLRKAPALVGSEWRASLVAWLRLAAIARSRARIRNAARVTGMRPAWALVAPLRVRRADLKRRFDDGEDSSADIDRRGELHFFTGGGAWIVLGALALGLGAFFALLAWPVLGGGGLLPLRESLVDLWGDAAYGRRALGLDEVGAPDPFAAIVALLGSLTPWHPSQAFVILWVLALPLAALGGWFAATRLSARAGVRIVAAMLFTLAPSFLTALIEGRPAAVLAHLLLPWLFYTGSVAKRSWGPAGAASLLFAAVLACAPSLAPALLVLWLAALVTAGRRALRVAWIPIPAVAAFAPLIWERAIVGGDPWGLLADPGLVWAAPQAGADAAGRILLATGFATPDLAGWATLAPSVPQLLPILLLAPLAVLALVSLISPRWPAGGVLLVTALLGIATAFAAVGITVQSANGEPVALWPGPALSLAWLGVVGAAMITLDTPLPRRVRALRPWAAAISVLAVTALAFPSLTAMLRDDSALTNGPENTLPAYVAAVGRDDPDVATIVLTPLADGGVAARVVWGSGESLGGQSTALSARAEPTASDREVAALSADLIAPSAADVAGELSSRAIGFVLLAPGAGTEAADALVLQAVASLDARAGLETVGDTTRGRLWRVTGDLQPRPELTRAETALQGSISLAQLVVAAIAVLLAFPTAASRRAARAEPRIVGAAPAWGAAGRARRERRAKTRRDAAAAAPSAVGAGAEPEPQPVTHAEAGPERDAAHADETGSAAGPDDAAEAEAGPDTDPDGPGDDTTDDDGAHTSAPQDPLQTASDDSDDSDDHGPGGAR
jgi:GT2 family glycosyltransferase